MHIGTIGNTEVEVSPTYLFIVLLVLFSSIGSLGFVHGFVQGVTILAIATFIIFAHEMGHIKAGELVSLCKESTLTFWALGGAATMPSLRNATPKQELIVAIAGPAVNFAFVLLALPVMSLLDISFFSSTYYDPSQPYLHFALSFFIVINAAVGLFNLLPSLPMDGGRILRSLLSMLFGKITGTKISVVVAWLIGLAMIAFGFFNGAIMIALIGFFVLFASLQEWKEVKKNNVMNLHQPY